MWAHDQTPPIYLALHCAYFWHLYITCCTYSNDMQDSVPYVLSDPLSFVLCTYESTQVDSVWMCCPLCQHDCRLLPAIATFSKLFFRVLAVTGMLVLPRKASSTAGTFLFVCFSGLVLQVGTHQVFFFSFWAVKQNEKSMCVWVNYSTKNVIKTCGLHNFFPLQTFCAKVCVCSMQCKLVSGSFLAVNIVNFFQHTSDDYAQTFLCYASLAGLDLTMRSFWHVPFFARNDAEIVLERNS